MRALVWCNGDPPSDTTLTGLVDGATIFGIDGGADKASQSGYEVSEVLGDLDSISRTGMDRLPNWPTSRVAIL